MRLQIHVPGEHKNSVEQIVDFYLCRLNDRVRSLEVDVRQQVDHRDKHRYRVELVADRSNGGSVVLEEVQSNIGTALHRALDRLVRRVTRRRHQHETSTSSMMRYN